MNEAVTMKTYKTRRLLLKQLNDNKAYEVLDYYLRNKAHLLEWEAHRNDLFYTLEKQNELLKSDLISFSNGQSLKLWIYTHEDTEKIIGCISIQNILRSIMQSCLLGYKLDHMYVGHGYMAEALEKVIEIIFTELELNRIEAPIMPKNITSSNVIKRMGFSEEGITRKMMKVNGKWEDHIRWSLLNPTHQEDLYD